MSEIVFQIFIAQIGINFVLVLTNILFLKQLLLLLLLTPLKNTA